MTPIRAFLSILFLTLWCVLGVLAAFHLPFSVLFLYLWLWTMHYATPAELLVDVRRPMVRRDIWITLSVVAVVVAFAAVSGVNGWAAGPPWVQRLRPWLYLALWLFGCWAILRRLRSARPQAKSQSVPH